MLNRNVHRRRSKLPQCYREELQSQREAFFTVGRTGEALTAIMQYAKLPTNSGVCEESFRIATEEVQRWIRTLPDPARSPCDIAHRCEYTIARLQHAINWAECLMRHAAGRDGRRIGKKTILSDRFINDVRESALAAIPSLQQTQRAALQQSSEPRNPQQNADPRIRIQGVLFDI